MATSIYLKFAESNLKGNSTTQEAKDQIEVLSFSHGVSIPLTGEAASNKERVRGRTDHRNLTITKMTDQASPNLNLYCCQGKVVGKATLTIFEPKAEKPQVNFTYELDGVIVSSVEVTCGSDGSPVETVKLDYTTITWKQGTSNSAGWDLTKNTKK